MGPRERNDIPILIAEDSPLLGSMITDCMKKAGYTNLDMCPNGQVAWDKLESYRDQGIVDDKVSLIVKKIYRNAAHGRTSTYETCKKIVAAQTYSGRRFSHHLLMKR